MVNKEKDTDYILRITEDINHIKDIDALLDRILLEARRFVSADAGSIFLVEKDRRARKAKKFPYTEG